jgi:hypothetical protein
MQHDVQGERGFIAPVITMLEESEEKARREDKE